LNKSECPCKQYLVIGILEKESPYEGKVGEPEGASCETKPKSDLEVIARNRSDLRLKDKIVAPFQVLAMTGHERAFSG
jgi:hypothetical protein